VDPLSLETSEETIPGILAIEEMTEEEARRSLQAKPEHNQPPLQTIRTKHHNIAKLIAAKFKSADIGRKTGYTASYINTLRSNPAIKELVDHYSGEYDENMDELFVRMEALTIELLDELQSRLDDPDDRDDISIPELKSLLESLLDRTGRGPIRRVEKHTVSENRHAGIIKHVREVASEKRYDSVGRGRNGESLAARLALPPGAGLGVGEVEVVEPVGEAPESIRVDSEGADV
jgi:hypothetical protein